MLNSKEQIANEIIKLSKLNIFDKTRKREYVENRALLSYILYHYKKMNLTEIARFFRENNKLINHDTIIHYNKSFQSYARFNHKLSERLDAIIMKIDRIDYAHRRKLIKLKADILSEKNIDRVLTLITKLHKKEIKDTTKNYEKQI